MSNDIIRFPGLGIEVHIGKYFEIFGFKIAFYGLIIGIGMVVGAMIAYREARRTNQNVEDYEDFTIWAILMAILGARIYYVVFEWEYYKRNLGEIINIREGGLAIYGGIIASVITLVVFTKIKKMNTFQMMDTACLGLIVGQAIGRWGNFCNREAFGGYYTGLFAMELPMSEVDGATKELIENAVEGFISVHPTFLYESLWNLVGFCLMMLYRKHKKNHGEVFALYLLWYGIGRAWIEGLRTDQLIIGNTGIPVSQALSIVLILVGGGWLIYSRFIGKENLAKADKSNIEAE